MPNTREKEKLVELLEERRMQASEVLGSMNKGFGAWYADHLIANGVTVHGDKDINVPTKWISVKDRLPEFTEEEMERYMFLGDTFFPEFNVMILGATQATTLYFDGERWYDEESCCYCVTHWQPLPPAPKGE